MFAGPNGSGKSTIKNNFPKELLGVYINPDEIEKELQAKDQLDLSSFYLENSASKDLAVYLTDSKLLERENLLEQVSNVAFQDNIIKFNNIEINSYYASVISSFIRESLLDNSISFSFETVMSHYSKIDFLKRAQEKGFKTYLYFVATSDPKINIARVHERVENGGHPVPEDRIVDRYSKSLDLLPEAIKYTDRTFVFDNSGKESKYLAEIENGIDLKFESELIPVWFNRIVERMMVDRPEL